MKEVSLPVDFVSNEIRSIMKSKTTKQLLWLLNPPPQKIKSNVDMLHPIRSLGKIICVCVSLLKALSLSDSSITLGAGAAAAVAKATAEQDALGAARQPPIK